MLLGMRLVLGLTPMLPVCCGGNRALGWINRLRRAARLPLGRDRRRSGGLSPAILQLEARRLLSMITVYRSDDAIDPSTHCARRPVRCWAVLKADSVPEVRSSSIRPSSGRRP